ncbi:MAG: radical SAM protein [Candidatus Omnitrophota bacterium]
MELLGSSQNRVEILFAPTWDCSLRCKYCFIQKNHTTKQDPPMSVDMAVKIMDVLDAGFSDVKQICIHYYGGEAFCNFPVIQAMVRYARENKAGRFSFIATTNGTHLSDEILETLEMGKFYLVLSIDGPEAIHDQCRRTANDSPSHATVLRFLEAVRSRTSCLVCGSSVIRSGWSLRQAVSYLRSLPVHSLKAQVVRIPTGTPYALTAEERKAYLDDLDLCGQWVIEDLESGQLPKDPRFSSKVLQLLSGESRPAFCGAGLTFFGINPSGHVRPCLLVDEPGATLGHVTDDPKQWRNAGMRWRERPLKEKCHTCPSFKLCGGGCPAILSVCGGDECDVITKNCEIATRIFDHFKDQPETLLAMAGML